MNLPDPRALNLAEYPFLPLMSRFALGERKRVDRPAFPLTSQLRATARPTPVPHGSQFCVLRRKRLTEYIESMRLGKARRQQNSAILWIY